jgi:uncharacterized protein (TIGR00730 family)
MSLPFVPSLPRRQAPLPKTIAVFGSSEPQAGSAAYETAYRLGSLLAAARYPLVTGGYAGVMEAASHGAREAGGTTIGIACAIFGDRRPNPHLDEVVIAADLYERTRELIERAAGYVVLPGKSGTLAELALLWALDRAGCLKGRPVVLLGSDWQPLIDLLRRSDMLESSQLHNTHITGTPAEAVELLTTRLGGSADE